MTSKRLPRTLVQAIRYFADPDVANEYFASLRWPNGPVCPTCGSTAHSFLSTRRVWKCRDCKKQYSVKVGTIFEDSPIKLGDWLASIWLIANSKNGISSYELARAIGITQKSAWFVNHRIRLAMQIGNFDKFDGETEADETYIGGSAGNMHKRDRAQVRRNRERGQSHLVPAIGVLQRAQDGKPSQVRATTLVNTKKAAVHDFVRASVKPGSFIATDRFLSYNGLGDTYDHQKVDHEAGQYVNGRVTTNGIENFWALLKRGINGTYVQVAPWHLFRYIDERVFTFNERDLTDLGRFSLVLQRITGRRLTYATLTGKK